MITLASFHPNPNNWRWTVMGCGKHGMDFVFYVDGTAIAVMKHGALHCRVHNSYQRKALNKIKAAYHETALHTASTKVLNELVEKVTEPEVESPANASKQPLFLPIEDWTKAITVARAKEAPLPTLVAVLRGLVTAWNPHLAHDAVVGKVRPTETVQKKELPFLGTPPFIAPKRGFKFEAGNKVKVISLYHTKKAGFNNGAKHTKWIGTVQEVESHNSSIHLVGSTPGSAFSPLDLELVVDPPAAILESPLSDVELALPETKPKFKVGDVVTLKRGAPATGGLFGFNHQMAKYIGIPTTIKSISRFKVRITIDNGTWSWHVDDLDKKIMGSITDAEKVEYDKSIETTNMPRVKAAKKFHSTVGD